MRLTRDRIRVLHVDDDPHFAELTATALEREDDCLDVATATAAAEGLDYLADNDVDCVVSDYDMPRLNGLECFEVIREQHGDLPFILYTGKGSEEVASDAISVGVTDYLQKGGGTDQYALLANRIRNAVEGDRSQAVLQERTRRLETLIDTLPGMVYRCRNEREWPMTFVGGECESLCGYTADQLQSDDVVWGEEVIHRDDQEELVERVQAALDADEPFEVTYRIVTADGERRWMWERGQQVDTAEDGTEILEGFITDITALTEHEQELERTNAVLSTLFDGLPVGILAEDASRRVMAVNQHLLELFGIDEAAESVVGADCASLAAEISDQFVDADGFTDRLDELVRERTPVSGERLALTDGRTLERTHRPIELPDGAGHLWVYRDVTDHVSQTAELERYEGIVTASGDPVYTLDAHGRFTSVNDALVEMTGHDRETLVGSHIEAVTTPESVERGRQVIGSLLRSREDRQTMEMTVVTSDGERIPCEAHVALLPSESSFRGTVGIIRDISDRKERERKLEGVQARTQALIRAETTEETAQAAVDTAQTVLGFERSAFYRLDETGSAFGRVAASGDGSPDDVDREMLVGEAFHRDEPLELDAEGSVRPLVDDSSGGPPDDSRDRRVIAHPVADHGVFVVSTPETGLSETDAALVEILLSTLTSALDRTEREMLLRERERELQRQNDRLEQFASVVSHDLRNPLNVATGRLELAQMECDSEHLAAVEAAHDRMQSLIEDLLTLARQGEAAIDFEPVDLAATLDACWSNVDTANATLVNDTDRIVHADAGRLQQLLENVVRNAVEHSEHGAVTVTAGDVDGGFYLADDGPGISPDQREAVFETGYSTSDDGTGFGLSIVEEIVDAHGWEVSITESAAGGARFEFTGVRTV